MLQMKIGPRESPLSCHEELSSTGRRDKNVLTAPEESQRTHDVNIGEASVSSQRRDEDKGGGFGYKTLK